MSITPGMISFDDISVTSKDNDENSSSDVSSMHCPPTSKITGDITIKKISAETTVISDSVDEECASKPVIPHMMQLALDKMQETHEKPNEALVPSVSDIKLNADSSLDIKSTLEAPCEDLAESKISKALDKSYDDLKKVSLAEQGLQAFAEDEVSGARERVIVHFIIGNIVVDTYDGFTGDRMKMPSLDDIAKVMGSNWDINQFAGWNSNGIASKADVYAVIKQSFIVRILIANNFMKEIRVHDGTKVMKIVESVAKELNLITPILTNYSVYSHSRIITSNATISIEPKTQAARERLGNAQMQQQSGQQYVVVFAIRPSDVGIDTSLMSKDELKKAMIISRVTVSAGQGVEPPSDELLQQHGLQLPFDAYYQWSHDLNQITENCVIKAIPLKISSKIANESKEDLLESGANAVKRAWNAVKYPAILYMEHKLLKEFNNGNVLKTKDFVFLQRGGELMFYKYTGVKPTIEIPAIVNGMYVKYLHPCAFTDGPFKLSTLLNKRKLFSVDRFCKSGNSTTCIILPITIKYLPANFLYRVSGVETLVVPESVSRISPNAFNDCNLQDVYFNGTCPTGFDPDTANFNIFVRRKYYKSFFE